jgi:hypothetical protein
LAIGVIARNLFPHRQQRVPRFANRASKEPKNPMGPSSLVPLPARRIGVDRPEDAEKSEFYRDISTRFQFSAKGLPFLRGLL